DYHNAFQPTAELNIKIATRGHSNFLNATAVGTATLINHQGKRLIFKNTLLVPSLTQLLISIPWVFKKEILITKKMKKGATIIIDNNLRLLGSFKNNLLELHSSHFEVIKPYSLPSQDSPNWNTRLGHLNPKYQEVLVPNSVVGNCSIWKTCKLKALPFAGKFKAERQVFKLNPISERGINNLLSYQILKLEDRKIVRVRNIKFDKFTFPGLKDEKSQEDVGASDVFDPIPKPSQNEPPVAHSGGKSDFSLSPDV
ncbi:uncharacterized protein VP01_6296g1, partial [Puccinia sorghi]